MQRKEPGISASQVLYNLTASNDFAQYLFSTKESTKCVSREKYTLGSSKEMHFL